MRKQKFSELLAQLKDLTEAQRAALHGLLGKAQHEKSPATLVDEKFATLYAPNAVAALCTNGA